MGQGGTVHLFIARENEEATRRERASQGDGKIPETEEAKELRSVDATSIR
jgi:hypothetical protein